jgi:hypothetical protein
MHVCIWGRSSPEDVVGARCSLDPELLDSADLAGCAVTYGESAGSLDSVVSGICNVIAEVDATG